LSKLIFQRKEIAQHLEEIYLKIDVEMLFGVLPLGAFLPEGFIHLQPTPRLILLNILLLLQLVMLSILAIFPQQGNLRVLYLTAQEELSAAVLVFLLAQ